jgi:non-heme chloroperoxidase
MLASDRTTDWPTERWATGSGVRIRFLDNSPGTSVGLPILLSPGVTDFAGEYAEVLTHLLPRRAVVVEVRGRGQSDAPAMGYAAADHADDLAAALDEAGIDRFHLMTFSRGTTWGLDLVLRDPARVATVSIGEYWTGEHALEAHMADMLMATRFRGRPMVERVQPHVLTEMFRVSQTRDLCDELVATSIPVLMATGTSAEGRMLNDDTLAEYRRRIPGLETIVIEGAGHDLFRPDRHAYPSAVSDFIVRRAPGT